MRIRCHGDYHLGQLLFTGKDFVITDFEGEPIRPLSERRLKRSPLRDVASMLRSFHYAAYGSLFESGETTVTRTTYAPALEPWARFWYGTVSAVFLHHYLALVRGAPLLPPSDDELALLLDAYLLEKAVYELGYELNNRPDWAMIPLGGILQLLHA
jgi:maltose alpha-D-glucosyltransferase/alpha-amylase